MRLCIAISASLLALTACWSAPHPVSAQDARPAAAPGDTLSAEYVGSVGLDSLFRTGPVPDDVFALMQGRTFKSDCTVPREQLRYLRCLHKDADGNIIVGEMVVNGLIAGDLLAILRELYLNSYPIQKMRLPDLWEAVDEDMMRANSSSCFNFRFISHTSKVSKHGLGIAVDINPLYNPYWKVLPDGTETVEPATATEYVDRTSSFPYKIEPDDLCVRLFKAHGFTWGGDWQSCKDWQHFER